MPAYINELNSINEYINSNTVVRKLIKFKINQIEQGITDVDYFQTKDLPEQIQLNLPGFS